MTWARLLVDMLTMIAIYAILNHLYNKPRIALNKKPNERNYIVKIPAALKQLSMVMFVFGIILYFVFGLIYLKGNPTVTIGHLWFALIFAGIGLLIMIWAMKWQIIVKDEQLEIRRLLHVRKVFYIRDIDKVDIGPKDQLTMYKSGKKIVTVDFLAENYDALKNTLKYFNKIS